ncbi:PucR family transcriptional regulator [Marinococcus luteus]|uniref:PucR family transcriptional regulator n=1 Tax=Marinococcus luteus TaxID=1122204 RepID=UPI002ACCE808|nr:helix-turn-helix domain-containing protein [Marinococcus luteus]MDZ5783671.1 helix-turn-helix domain-containing protein [Marinococcus luteus]
MHNDIISLFPEAVPQEHWKEITQPEQHFYYRLPDGTQLAIPIHSLSAREKHLLETVLTPVSPGSWEDSPWEAYLQAKSDTLPEHIPSPFRFLFLEGSSLYRWKNDIYDTLLEYYQRSVILTVLGDEKLLAVIPDDDSDEEEVFEAQELSTLLMGDTMVDASVYCGRKVYRSENIRLIYQQEQEMFSFLQEQQPSRRSFAPFEALPGIHMVESTRFSKKELLHYALSGLEQDEELMHTLYTFFLENLNSSATAKRLHLHRNTLKYRLDKVTDRLGIDVKQFLHAAPLFLLLQAQYGSGIA